jgi:hypothetical protein
MELWKLNYGLVELWLIELWLIELLIELWKL